MLIKSRAGLGALFKEQYGKPLIGVGEVLDRREIEETELLLEPQRIELAADFDENLFIPSPVK